MRRTRTLPLALGVVGITTFLATGCPPGEVTPVEPDCPEPSLSGVGHFYQPEAGKNRVIFVLTEEHAGDPGASFKLGTVDIYGGPGELTAEEVLAEPKFELRSFTPESWTWTVDDLKSAAFESMWVEGKPYTIAVRSNYQETSGGGKSCSATEILHFRNIQTTPLKLGNDLGTPVDTGSEGANSNVSGLFFGSGGGYAFYEGWVDYDDSDTAQAVMIECFSSSVQSELFNTENKFKEKTGLPPDRWEFPSIRDTTYDGSSDPWYVGFKLTYSGTPPNPDHTEKVFLDIAVASGTSIPGE